MCCSIDVPRFERPGRLFLPPIFLTQYLPLTPPPPPSSSPSPLVIATDVAAVAVAVAAAAAANRKRHQNRPSCWPIYRWIDPGGRHGDDGRAACDGHQPGEGAPARTHLPGFRGRRDGALQRVEEVEKSSFVIVRLWVHLLACLGLGGVWFVPTRVPSFWFRLGLFSFVRSFLRSFILMLFSLACSCCRVGSRWVSSL